MAREPKLGGRRPRPRPRVVETPPPEPDADALPPRPDNSPPPRPAAEVPRPRLTTPLPPARTEDEEPRAEQPKVDSLLHCLIRLTQYYGRPVGEADIRASAAIDPDGMSVDAFRLASQRMGYKVGAAPLTAEQLDHLPPPFITRGTKQDPSRLVLERTATGFMVYDPGRGGTVELTGPEVLAFGDGVLLVKPLSSVEREATGWRGLIVDRIKGVLWELALASFVVNIFALASALFTMVVYNKVLGQNAVDTLTVLAFGMITVYVFDTILRLVRGYISSHTGARLESLIGGEVLHHLLHLPYKHFENTASGMIAERMRQLDTIRNFFTGQMPLTVVDLLFVVIFVAALFFIDPLVGWVTIGAMPVFVLLSLAFHHTQRKLAEQAFMSQAAKASALNETISNALTVKSLALESEIERRFDQRLGVSAWTGFRATNLSNAISVIGNLLQQVVGLIIIVGGARLIIAGEMSMGELIAANMLASRALAPMRQIVSAWHQVQQVADAFRRLDDIMSEPVEMQPGELGPGLPLKGDIKFENISFRYTDDGPPTLDQVSLSIDSGTVLGIMGPSGSGKSTLAKLLQGLYSPSEGRVLIDGTDVAHISPATLRRQIGVVPQEVQLFAGTVRENIALGIADKDPARVVAVAKFVGAHDFIQHLPKGYDTVLSERGGGLSAGQRQLLAVARALIRNPRIMVLDEATSALDIVTEERLIRNLKRAGRGRTIIVVSHRIAPIAIADRAALVIDGRVERVGPPQEIIAFARARMADRLTEQQG